MVRFDSPAIGRMVDVEVNGRKLWTTQVPEAAGRAAHVRWPTVLHNHINGAGTVVLRDQRNGLALAEGRYSWPAKPGAVGLAQLVAAGQVIDKWGKLTDAPSDELHRRLTRSMQTVLADLADLGYTAAITGGTLLGAVREGRILAHDDDIDLLVYLGEVAPPDVSIASYELERRIRARGHEVIRHSDAHLQVLFADEAAGDARLQDEVGSAVHVDLFLGFHDRGVYNQPIAVRGTFAPASLLPLGEVTLEGVPVPSVADGDAWLALCYGKGWRTPDPSFRFRTPSSTRRRFENWFGVYDLNRDFWERHIRLGRSRHWYGDVERLLAATKPGDRVIDLGCGDGELAESLAAAGRRVVAVDYARAALAAASSRADLAVHRLNLADRRAVLDFIADELAVGGTRHFLLSNVLHTLTREARANTFLLLRALIDAGSVALASFSVNASFVYDHDRPDTWHLPLRWLRDEASAFGLGCAVEARQMRKTAAGPRTVATVRLYSTKVAASAVREEAR
ncbi:methyltransferase domain-containing protein [Agromyces sp. H3Y2-19a]|uniref:methyltransferase domain-containing protein n=1 Tax=Agromyces chromiiresistens TaxID=3030835 RepID=UPI0023B8DD1B|nr:methyltransferase domain-containing protein [Agromyces chromiiresistens]MDF0514648.1 methyltransferase domain-containing protein [Agromyces chromiiresistens]